MGFFCLIVIQIRYSQGYVDTEIRSSWIRFKSLWVRSHYKSCRSIRNFCSNHICVWLRFTFRITSDLCLTVMRMNLSFEKARMCTLIHFCMSHLSPTTKNVFVTQNDSTKWMLSNRIYERITFCPANTSSAAALLQCCFLLFPMLTSRKMLP